MTLLDEYARFVRNLDPDLWPMAFKTSDLHWQDRPGSSALHADYKYPSRNPDKSQAARALQFA
jgi:hypothetical protein